MKNKMSLWHIYIMIASLINILSSKSYHTDFVYMNLIVIVVCISLLYVDHKAIVSLIYNLKIRNLQDVINHPSMSNTTDYFFLDSFNMPKLFNKHIKNRHDLNLNHMTNENKSYLLTKILFGHKTVDKHIQFNDEYCQKLSVLIDYLPIKERQTFMRLIDKKGMLFKDVFLAFALKNLNINNKYMKQFIAIECDPYISDSKFISDIKTMHKEELIQQEMDIIKMINHESPDLLGLQSSIDSNDIENRYLSAKLLKIKITDTLSNENDMTFDNIEFN